MDWTRGLKRITLILSIIGAVIAAVFFYGDVRHANEACSFLLLLALLPWRFGYEEDLATESLKQREPIFLKCIGIDKNRAGTARSDDRTHMRQQAPRYCARRP